MTPKSKRIVEKLLGRVRPRTARQKSIFAKRIRELEMDWSCKLSGAKSLRKEEQP